MTRKTLNARLFSVAALLMSLLVLALTAKLSGNLILADFYIFIKDMSVLIALITGVYLVDIFQRRSTFLKSLRDQWQLIITAKAVLLVYCEREQPVAADFTEAYREISQAIDHMRIVYRNVGETVELAGYYPYEPLHDMRRAMEEIDPRRGRHVTLSDRRQARQKIVVSFDVMREHFLDEFDVESPSDPIVGAGAQRLKKDGGSISNSEARKLRKSGVRI